MHTFACPPDAANISGVFPSVSKQLMFRPMAALCVKSRMALRTSATLPRSHAEKMSGMR